jgi:PAS domain S-box-containing protein
VSRASLAARAGGAAGVADVGLRPAVRTELARRTLAESPLGEFGQAAVAVVLVGAFWGTAGQSVALPWLGAVVVAAGTRALARRRLAQAHATPEAIARVTSRVVLVSAAIWGVGPVLLARAVPFELYALLILTFAGLIAGGTVTLAADRRTFYAFVALLCGPLAVGLALGGLSRVSGFALVLVILFAGLMTALFERAHATLLGSVAASEQASRREAEAARGREYLDALLASAPTAIATVGADGRVLGVNPAFETLFGYTGADATGRVLNELVVPESERAKALALEERARTGHRVVTEVERRRKDGRLVPVRVSAARVAGDVGADTLFVLYDDITANRNAERAMREAERQYRELVESSTDLVWEVDGAGRWVFLNAAGEEIYGAEPEDLLGRPFADRVDPSRLEADRAALARVFAGEGLVDYETVHRDVHGGPKRLSFSARPVRDASGGIVGAHGTARDVTARAEARAALEEARAVAERTAEVRSAFVANMSHEIRTPMNGVLGLVELLLDTELTPEQRRSAELVRSSGEALLGVIDDVLDFSKIEAGHLELEAVPFDLHSLVEGTVGMLAPRASQRGLEVVADLAPDLPRGVRGDAGRLRQVLTNLIGNAIKFTSQGQVVVAVRPESAAGAGAIRFAVEDSGIGIPADRLEAVFGEFTQVDASTTRKYGGTGLGLAISRRLVRLMGGELTVRSEEGQGSEFSFVVPLPDAPDGVVAAIRPVAFQGERALVVDDNAANRRIVREMLKVAGLVVDEAESAAQGLAILRAAAGRAEPYGLSVIDAQMPDRDGFELAADVRADPMVIGVRLLMLTSAGRRGDGQRCREVGVDGYLQKPVGRVELLEAIAAVMGHAGGTRETLVTRHSMQERRRRLRVLLAEDNPVNQEVAVALLQRRGHEVVVVENGRMALEAIQGAAFDVVLMDVQMPEMDGLAATRAIRALPSGGDLPIIAVTAHALASERARCLEAGMTACVVKPYRPHELIAVVEGWAGELAADAGSEAEVPEVDLAGLRRSLEEAGAGDATDALVGTFVGDAAGRMRDVEAAVAAADAAGVARAAHAYKSAAGTIGARSLADLLRRLETAGKAGDLPQARGLLAEVGAAHTAALAYLERERGH